MWVGGVKVQTGCVLLTAFSRCQALPELIVVKDHVWRHQKTFELEEQHVAAENRNQTPKRVLGSVLVHNGEQHHSRV